MNSGRSVHGRARRTTRRLLSASAVAAFAVLAAISPAGPAVAVMNGSVDGVRHGYVGAADGRSLGGATQFGSGVLVSPTVFLTAGHGTAHFDAAGVTRARVTLDATITAASTWYEGTVHTNPAYDATAAGLGNKDIGDLGVIVFDHPVTGVTPASLPTEGFLDRVTSGARVEIAGYGVSQYTGASNGGGRRTLDFSSGGTRRDALEAFASLSASWLRLRSVGNADICSGDSGSPGILSGTNIVVGITDLQMSLDGSQCESAPWEERVDTPASRAFLSLYVDLP